MMRNAKRKEGTMGNDNEQKIADAMRQWRARAIEDEATIAKLQAEAATLRAMAERVTLRK